MTFKVVFERFDPVEVEPLAKRNGWVLGPTFYAEQEDEAPHTLDDDDTLTVYGESGRRFALPAPRALAWRLFNELADAIPFRSESGSVQAEELKAAQEIYWSHVERGGAPW